MQDPDSESQVSIWTSPHSSAIRWDTHLSDPKAAASTSFTSHLLCLLGTVDATSGNMSKCLRCGFYQDAMLVRKIYGLHRNSEIDGVTDESLDPLVLLLLSQCVLGAEMR